MSGRLDGKVVLITGAGSGLGRESALLFAAEGAAVVVTDLIPSRADRVVAEVWAAGGQAAGAKADGRQAREMADAVGLATETFGRLDVLMCSAGVPEEGVGTRSPICVWSAPITVRPVAGSSVVVKPAP